MKELIFISCTKGAKEQTPLYESLTKLGVKNFHFVEHNQQGLAACYNKYLDRYAGNNRILVFVHDDVTIADVFVEEKINEAIAAFNIVGVAGSASLNLNARLDRIIWLLAPLEDLSGAVEHIMPNGRNSWTYFGETPKPCLVLDGLVLAVDMKTIGNVRFCEEFDFHFYDLDFCLQCHDFGLTLGTTNVYVNHRSGGDFSSVAYLEAMHRFRNKWQPYFEKFANTESDATPEQFLVEQINRAGSDHHEYFGASWTGGYGIQQQPEELAQLIVLLQQHAPFSHTLEIGIAAGGTTRFIREIVAIDDTAIIDDGRHPRFALWAGNRECISNVVEHIGNSHGRKAKAFLQGLDRQFDLVGIDGDHTYVGVKQDWELVRPFLAPGALVWFHDIHVEQPESDGAHRLWREELSQEFEVLLETTGRFGIGVIRV